MSADERVAAIVVAYNGGDDLIACVQSLLDQTIALEIIVVDNASSDGSIERLEATYGSSIRVIRNPTNGGYAAGANIGWRATDAPIVTILNQDVCLHSDGMELLRSALKSEAGPTLVTPKLVMRHDPQVVNAVGTNVALTGVSWCRGVDTDAADWSGVHEVVAISGAAFMTRRSLLQELDGLDESYLMYLEDVDLSLRARIVGARCLAVCDAIGTHDWELRLVPWKFECLERNRRAFWSRFIGQHSGMWIALLQAEMMAWAYAFLRGKGHVRAKWRAARSPLSLKVMQTHRSGIIDALETRHPYHVLFPGSPAIAAVGWLADRAVLQAIRAWRTTTDAIQWISRGGAA